MLYEDEDQYEDPDIYSRLLDCLGGISRVLKTQETSKEDVRLLSNSLKNLWEVMKEETEYDNGNKLSFEAIISSIQMEVGQRSTVDDDSCDEETETREEVREGSNHDVVISGVADQSPEVEMLKSLVVSGDTDMPIPGAEMLQLPDGGNNNVVSDVADEAKSPEFEILKSLKTSGDTEVLMSPDTERLQSPDAEMLPSNDAEKLKSNDDRMLQSPDVELLDVEEMDINKTARLKEIASNFEDNDGNDEKVMEKEKLDVGEMDTDKAKLIENVCYHEDNEENDVQVKDENDLRIEERDNDKVNLNILAYYKDKDRNEKQGKKTDELFDVIERTEKINLKGTEKWRYPPHCKIRFFL